MARSIWSGSISFGLVNVPVRMFVAQRDHDVGFHQLHEGTSHRVRYQKVDEETGRKLDADDIVKAFQLPGGKWVTFTDEELAELKPASTRTLDITDFVDLAEVDPIYFDRTYYLGPGEGAGAERAYRLLLLAMKERGRAGIGTVVIRNKQYLAAVRPEDKVLALSTMRFADEVVSASDIDDLKVPAAKVSKQERDLALALVDSLAGPFQPDKYHDTYTEEMKDLIARKAKGETIEVEEPEAGPPAKVTDLMEALQASLDAAKGSRRRARRPAKKQGTRPKPAAGRTKAKGGAKRRRAA
jgi:DNA end-binding protein Ku